MRYYDDRGRSWIFIDRRAPLAGTHFTPGVSSSTLLRDRYDTSRWNHATCSARGTIWYLHYFLLLNQLLLLYNVLRTPLYVAS